MATAKKKAAPAARRATTTTRATAKTKQKAAPARRAARRGLTLASVDPGLTADDIQKSLAFYRDVLGFEEGERWEQDGKLLGIELRAGEAFFMIGQDDWKKGRNRVKGEAIRLYCETTQDIDALAARIEAAGGRLTQEPTDHPEWGMRDLALEDPDGFKITIGRKLKGGRKR